MKQLRPEMERLDGREFLVGELVKSWNIVQNKWIYCYVIEDHRFLSHCNYGYTLAPVVDEPSQDNRGYTVYGCEPKYIEPCTDAERVLFENPNNFFKKSRNEQITMPSRKREPLSDRRPYPVGILRPRR